MVNTILLSNPSVSDYAKSCSDLVSFFLLFKTWLYGSAHQFICVVSENKGDDLKRDPNDTLSFMIYKN